MEIIHTVAEMQSRCRALKLAGKRIGLVPTMGALHAGHISLVRAARERCDIVAVSIFVNPKQFGPTEDFAKYPRTIERDCELLAAEEVDIVFAPGLAEMYPASATTFVLVEGLSEKLDGRSRPGHFRGVTTVVNKLFHVVAPDIAFFGQKDAAQCAILKKMIHDLGIKVELAICPIVREGDGLALSSRNAYLNPEERRQSLVLYRALQLVKSLYDQGERKAAALLAAARRMFREEEEKGVQIEYSEIVDAETLEPVQEAASGTLVAVAAKVGSTRLIDNIVL